MTASLKTDGEGKPVALVLHERDFLNWSFRITCFMCPIQIEGEIDGIPYYFRERHGRFRLEVFEEHLIHKGEELGDHFKAMELISERVQLWEHELRQRGLVKGRVVSDPTHFRLRYLRALVAHALARHQHPGWTPMITNQGRDVDKPSVFLEVEVGGHAYTITITEDR